MKHDQINVMAIIVAALSSFAVGGLWYSPLLFGNAWMRANGFTPATVQAGNQGKIFGISFILNLVMAANLAFFLAEPNTTAVWGAMAGALAGIGWVATSIGVLGLFERRSWTWIGINAGYPILALTVMGLILGAWRN